MLVDMAQRELSRDWRAILGQLELELPPHSFDTWLRDTGPLAMEGDVLSVGARNSFECEWLNKRLNLVVERAAYAVIGREVRVVFVPRRKPEDASNDDDERPEPEAPQVAVGRVNAAFTFDRYVVSEGNRLALGGCRSLVEEDDVAISPIVLHGTPGMGKTHLLHALAAAAAAKGLVVACLSAEEFATRYLGALRRQQVEAFQGTVRGVDLFILDDLQYLEGKKGTLDELVHTIDAVTHAGGHVVVASERHPAELELPERLGSRLLAGVVARVGPLGVPERRVLVDQVARACRAALPGWAIDRVLGIEVASARILQGAVHVAVALQRSGDLDLASLDERLVRVCIEEVAPRASCDSSLLEQVARHFGTSLADLTGRSRAANLTAARAVAVATLKARGRSLSEIALELGGRDRSTISQLADRGRQLLEADLALRTRFAS